MNTPDAYIGIDLASSRSKITWVSLDGHLQPEAVRSGDLDEALAFVGQYAAAAVGVHAPRRLNQGIVTDPDRRAQLALPIRPGRPGEMRVAEYALRLRKLPVYRTPAQPDKAKPWMAAGFSLYRHLEQGDQFRVLEVLPEVCFWVWLGKRPLPRGSLEGRLQRQLILYEMGVDIADPMLFFQEITRHRVYQGTLPLDDLYSPNELHALAAAFTAWLAARHPERVSFVGDKGEGEIAVPVAALKNSYR